MADADVDSDVFDEHRRKRCSGFCIRIAIWIASDTRNRKIAGPWVFPLLYFNVYFQYVSSIWINDIWRLHTHTHTMKNRGKGGKEKALPTLIKGRQEKSISIVGVYVLCRCPCYTSIASELSLINSVVLLLLLYSPLLWLCSIRFFSPFFVIDYHPYTSTLGLFHVTCHNYHSTLIEWME